MLWRFSEAIIPGIMPTRIAGGSGSASERRGHDSNRAPFFLTTSLRLTRLGAQLRSQLPGQRLLDTRLNFLGLVILEGPTP